jgi:type III pantothenate kinase
VILELDCGNTRVKWRVRKGGQTLMRGAFQTEEGFNSSITEELVSLGLQQVLVGSVLGDEYARKLAFWSISHLGLNPEFAASEPFWSGVVNGYQQPEKLGVDRWLAIMAARAKAPSAFVVVDCGSAITVDLVTSQGEHLGGYIAPGLRLMREALVTKTSAIKLSQIGYPDNDFPGRNTVTAIKSAELAMIAGLVDHARSILRNYDSHEAHLWVTGGDGEWLVGMLKDGTYYEDLVLDGLEIALAEAKT